MIARHLRGATSALCIVMTSTAVSPGAEALAHERPQGERVYSGEPAVVGGGTAHAWVSLDAEGRHEALGVNLSEAALQSLASEPTGAVILQFPREVDGSGFGHVLLNWSPHKHPLVELWGVTHVDAHFYLTSAPEREAMVPARPSLVEEGAAHPERRLLPVGYVTDGKLVPGIGLPWADAATLEACGEGFDHTVLYGSWDGKVTYIEPMATIAVFERRDTVVAPIKQPQAVATPLVLPTQYRIDFDENAREHRVVLEELVARK